MTARLDKRVTAVFGSGASVCLDCPSTSSLTAELRKQIVPIGPNGGTSKILDELGADLDQFFAKGLGHHGERNQAATFEDIFHLIEQLLSFNTAWKPKVRNDFRPALAALVTPNDKHQARFDGTVLNGAWSATLRFIGDEIAKAGGLFRADASHDWFRKFITMCQQAAQWDFATLNYDETLSHCLDWNSTTDGYAGSPTGIRTFDHAALLGTGKNSLLHLHGSVLFGYERPDRNAPNEWEDLAKFPTYREAADTWYGHGYGNVNQAGEYASIGPLITGLHKTDKLLAEPYLSYFQKFHSCLRSSPRLIVVGFSFLDSHVSTLLRRHSDWHGVNRRVVLVDYFPRPDEMFSGDPEVCDWPSPAVQHFVRRAAREWPFDRETMPDFGKSSDKCFRFYVRGFKHAVEKHQEDIVNFLLS